ncbi:DUF7344 domain-containing protein [Haloarchaeobius sp. HRN-SO-5]|uniref:DUF7344 domain-containing protein n=1 Tax=Haloarchaeobius sp. HRN-SO-5 TaxID=3446118 RepID=UPI003EBBD660
MTTLATAATTDAEIEPPERTAAECELLSEDEVFHVLQNQRRRWVLKYLEGEDGPVRMRDVAEQVAAWEHETTVQGLTSTQRQRVYIPLYQNHLPKLDKLGVIDYNQSRGIVERKPLADQLNTHLDPFEFADQRSARDEESEEGEFRWEYPYIGLSALGTFLVAGKAFGLSLLAPAPDLVLGMVILFLFTLTTSVRLVSERLAA